MKQAFFVTIFLFVVAWSMPTRSQAGPHQASSKDLKACDNALALAGAFSNDGYKIRDGYWCSSIEPGKNLLIEVNLFAGNEYWFCVAGPATDQKFALTVFDENGNPLEQNNYQDRGRAAAGVEPVRTGKYYVQLALNDKKKSSFCFVYCYK